jgi:hypothetical protein
MREASRYIGQALFYAVVACAIGYFSSRPVYTQIPANSAQIKMSFSHAGARKQPCRKLAPVEIAKLPPSERRPHTCARERTSIHVQLLLDEQMIYDAILMPTGLASDGPARTYQKFIIPAGKHTIEARMRDNTRTVGFGYKKRATLDLAPLQSLAIDFRADAGGFIFR